MLLDHAIEVCRKVPPEMQPVILLSVVQEQPLILALRYPLSEAMEEETAQLEAGSVRAAIPARFPVQGQQDSMKSP